MLDVFFISLSIPLALFLVTLIYRKVYRYSIFFLVIVGGYFIGVILFYFFVIGFNGNQYKFIFPDELTYLYGDSTGYFGLIVKSIVSSTSLLTLRFLNVFSYVFGLLWLITELLNSRYKRKEEVSNLKLAYVSLIAALGSYWSFFILKEGMSILGISIYLIACNQNNKILKLTSIGFMFFIRFEVALAIILAETIVFLWGKSKKLLYLFLIALVLIVIFYMNSNLSEAMKLSFVSRRYGESEKIFDSAARQAAQMGFFDFITSYTYFETILGNFLRSLVPFYYPFSPISTPLTLINLIGSIMMFTKIKKMKNTALIFGVITFMLLMTTISVARYVTVFIIPLTIYLLFMSPEKEKIGTEKSELKIKII